MRHSCGVMLLTLCCAVSVTAQDKGKAILNYSIVGSASCKTGPCWEKAIPRIEVQKVLMELAEAPREVAHVDAALQGSGVTRGDLEKLRLIRREGGRCFLNFTLLTARDVRTIREVSERYAQSLASAILARRPEIEAALRSYNAPGVDPGAVAFIVLGCFSLDWDGLALTASHGYRKSTDRRPDGRYVPEAQERFEMTYERLYWGSHNNGYGATRVTSFGDHYSLPRQALPDVGYGLRGREPKEGVPRAFMSGDYVTVGRQLSGIMFALRDRERTIEELGVAAGVPLREAETWVAFLSGLDYLSVEGTRYRTKVPVFVSQDRPMIERLRAIAREVMTSWLAANYAKIKTELNETTPTRWGVPYAEGFTEIWHWLFGIANRRLVEAGLFADPYAQARKYKGFIPAVYAWDLP